MLLVSSAFAGKAINTAGETGIALQGYDPVAFFTTGKATHGNPSLQAQHEGASYLFSSEKNLKLFQKSPEKYAPQFGGYCAYGVSVNALFPVDVSTAQVIDGKLYLNLNPSILEAFNKDLNGNLDKARQNWPSLIGAEEAAASCPHCCSNKR